MRLGLDIGGTKLEAALLGPDGAVMARARAPTPQDYDAALDAIVTLRHAVERRAGVAARACGAAIPGSISPVTGCVRNANTQWLNGRPLVEDLSGRLGLPVRAANDANCFALSEATDGAARGARAVFGVILGTGCGGGLVIDGRVLIGANAIAGEWGHTPLPWPSAAEWPGPRCWCGRAGCLELWISGGGFRRWSGMSGEDAVARAAAGDEAARDALDLLFDRIARGLAVVIDLFDPDVIVFGGGLSNIAALCPGVTQRLPAYVFSDVLRTRLTPNRHGDSSGVRGAAWLFAAEEAA